MKLIGISLLLAALALLGTAAFAQPQESKAVQYQAVSTTEIRKLTALQRPPLRLPNIAALSKALLKADRSVVSRQLVSSQKVLRFWNGKGRWLRAPAHAKCWEVPWQRSCTIARANQRLHSALVEIAETRLTRELPLTNDWRTAVRLVQRIYPGTESWMLAISDREGGWGPWVWWGGSCGSPPCLWHGYHIGRDATGDTVGGWMQFRYSTFAPYWRAAQADLKRRGIIVPFISMPPEGGPTQYAAWLSPLGQALTAGFMRYRHLDACHWCL